MKDPVNLIIFPSKRKRKIQRDFIFKSMTKNRQQCKLFVYNWAKAKLLLYRYHITLHIICSICHYTTWWHWVKHMTYAHGFHTHPSSSCYPTPSQVTGNAGPRASCTAESQTSRVDHQEGLQLELRWAHQASQTL